MSPWFKKQLKIILGLYALFLVVGYVFPEDNTWIALLLAIIVVAKIVQFLVYCWKSFWGWRVVLEWKR